MNDVIKQFNKRAEEIKPYNHQRALKMVALKALQAENLKRRDTKRGLFFNLFSMSLGKTLIAGLGIVAIIVAVVIRLNLAEVSLGFKNATLSSHAHAQEILKLTREQYNALTPEKRRRLGESVQGDLGQIWQEAEQAKDLEFLQGKEAQQAIVNDFILAQATSTTGFYNSYTSDFARMLQTSAFRFSDIKKRTVYIVIESFNPFDGPKLVVSTDGTTVSSSTESAASLINAKSKIRILTFNFSKLASNDSLNDKKREEIKVKLYQRISSKFPTLWSYIQSDPEASLSISEFHFDDLQSEDDEQKQYTPHELEKYFNITSYFDMRTKLKTTESDEPVEEEITLYRPPLASAILKFKNKNNKKYWIETRFDLSNVNRIFQTIAVWERTDE